MRCPHAYPNSIWTVCPCPEHSRQRARTRKRAEAGLINVPTVDEAWQAVAAMLDRGLTYRQIADAANVNHASLTQRCVEWKRGHKRRLQPLTRLALVCAEVATRDTVPAYVPAIGTRRRLWALGWMGWPLPVIAREAGLHKQTLQMIRSGYHDTCESRVHAAVAAFYDAHADTDGGDYRARARARNRGVPPPIAWDDDTIDDPDAQPGTRPRPKVSKRAARILRWIDAHRIGRTIEDIAREEGISVKAVHRHLDRHGRTDLARALWATRAHDENSAGRKAS